MSTNHGRPFIILRAGIEDGEERRQIKRSDSGRPQGQSVAYAMRAYSETGEPNGWHAGVYLDRWVNRRRSVRVLPGRYATHTDAGSAAWGARVLGSVDGDVVTVGVGVKWLSKEQRKNKACACGVKTREADTCRGCYIKAIKAGTRKRSDLRVEHFTIKSPGGVWAWYGNGTLSGAKIRLECWMWEEEHGEVPAGYIVQRVDRSKPASLDNLVLKTRSAIVEDAHEAKRARRAFDSKQQKKVA